MAGQVQRLSIAWAIFGAAAIAAAILILIASRETIFAGDELGILYRLAEQPLGQALFEPPAQKYLIAAPTLIYGVIAGIFGADSYLPYRILGVALVVLAAGLFLALARRRAPLALALPCSILLLVFGGAAEVVAVPARVPGQLAICAGLGVLLALDRGDRRGELIACALGTLAVISHPIGLAFVAAAAVICVLERPSRWRSLWVAAIPLLVYGLWWLLLREPADADVPLTLGDITAFARDAFIAVCAALTGIFRSPWTDDGNFINDATRVIAALAVIAAVIAVVRARRVSPGLLGALAALAVALIGPVLAPGALAFGFRAPEAARYVYPGAVLVLLVAVELVALSRRSDEGDRAPAGAWTVPVAAGAAAVFVIALVSNVAALIDGGSEFRRSSALVEAQFGAFDVAREGRRPEQRAAELDLSLDQSAGWLALMLGFSNPDGADEVANGAPAYYAIKDRYGLPADDAGELASADPILTDQVDRVLVFAYPLGFAPQSAVVCRGARRDYPPGQISLANGVLQIAPRGDAEPAVSLGRYSGSAVQPLPWPAGAPAAFLALPRAAPASTSWQVLAEGASVRPCPFG